MPCANCSVPVPSSSTIVTVCVVIAPAPPVKPVVGVPSSRTIVSFASVDVSPTTVTWQFFGPVSPGLNVIVWFENE
ncbi:MAG: hypothetical protein KatS3mg062_0914 [Tepidiforma sp.]|nr:MAG: hypothetical protein KatS3mg062_0914 [Tepidiforma sp.]